jgi:signal transduction histidine kinase
MLGVMWAFLLQDLSTRQKDLQRDHDDRIYNVTQVSAQALKGLLIAVDQTLLELREEWTAHPSDFAERVERRRTTTRASLGMDIHIGVIGADGRVQFSSSAPNALGYDASDNQHFALPRDTPTDRLFVNPPYFMPVAKQQLMPFSRRLLSADGRFNGVIVFWVPPDFVTHIYKTTRFEANSTFTLIELERGQVLLRHVKTARADLKPDREQTEEAEDPGELRPAFPVKDEFLSALVLTRAQQLPATGVGRWYSLIDQAERTFGWYKFKSVPFALVAGEPTAQIDQELATQRQRYWLAGILLSFLLSAAVTGMLALLRTRAQVAVRQSRQLQAMAEKQTEMEQSRKQLRRLSQHLASIRETERQRIAQELQDELGQRLSVVSLGAAHIAEQLMAFTPSPRLEHSDASEQRPEFDPAGVQHAAQILKAQIDVTTAVVQQIAEDLRPGALSVGLGPGIESLCEAFKDAMNMRSRCDIGLAPDAAIAMETATVAYWIIQESLSNVMRHAKATQFDVQLDAHDGWLLISISDNGLGFRPRENTHDTFGLLGMQERARALGGEVDIHSVPGLGTRVKARLPMQPAPAASAAEPVADAMTHAPGDLHREPSLAQGS